MITSVRAGRNIGGGTAIDQDLGMDGYGSLTSRRATHV